MEIKAPTAKPIQAAKNTFMDGTATTPSPKKVMLMVSSSIQSIKNQLATNVSRIAAQFPVSSAFCTCDSFASLDLIRTNKVPIIDAKTPTPAMTNGNNIGPIPLKETSSVPASSMSFTT